MTRAEMLAEIERINAAIVAAEAATAKAEAERDEAQKTLQLFSHFALSLVEC